MEGFIEMFVHEKESSWSRIEEITYVSNVKSGKL